ncbi:MAG: HU family DNA-binding protein [Pirellulaceae bacterium]
MTKKEIIHTIADDLGLTRQQTKEVVQKMFDAILEAIALERRVELRNFGVFEVVRRAPRSGRNLQTNEIVEIESRLTVAFKPGKELKARLSEIEERERLFGQPQPPKKSDSRVEGDGGETSG